MPVTVLDYPTHSMPTSCTEALIEALERYDRPEIFNTDRGSQFTSPEFTSVLNEVCVAISMDGKDRCLDNIFIERLLRSLKYEAVDLHEPLDGLQPQRLVARWFAFVIRGRPHSALGGSIPAEAYEKKCCQRCGPSAAACLPLCRLNQNTKS